MVVVLPIVRIGSDRRKQPLIEKEVPPWSGRYAIERSVNLAQELSETDRVRIAMKAISSISSHPGTLTDSAVIGWRGRWGIINHGQREIAVQWTGGPGSTTFSCYARPRYQRELLDLGMSASVVRRLANTVKDTAGWVATPRCSRRWTR